MNEEDSYRITIDGRLESHWAGWFDGLKLDLDETGRTVLIGPVRDQAQLYGILLKIRDLGLPLLEVSRREGFGPASRLDRRG